MNRFYPKFLNLKYIRNLWLRWSISVAKFWRQNCSRNAKGNKVTYIKFKK